MARSCTWSSLFKFCEAVTKLNEEEKIISWPDESRLERIQQAFEGVNQTGFPGRFCMLQGIKINL